MSFKAAYFEHALLRPLLSHGDIPDFAFAETEALLLTLKKSDQMTYEHCLRVGQSSAQLAQAMGLSEYEQKVAEFSGLLHDIGKLGIDPLVTHKPGRLTEEEYRLMMNHPMLTAKMLSHLSGISFFDQIIPAVLHHHERYDGLGYPHKINQFDIPLSSRIVLVVDTMDAMTNDRPYRKGMPIETVYFELKKFSGSQFDPEIVKIFIESFKHWSKPAKRPDSFADFHQQIKKQAA